MHMASLSQVSCIGATYRLPVAQAGELIRGPCAHFTTLHGQQVMATLEFSKEVGYVLWLQGGARQGKCPNFPCRTWTTSWEGQQIF